MLFFFFLKAEHSNGYFYSCLEAASPTGPSNQQSLACKEALTGPHFSFSKAFTGSMGSFVSGTNFVLHHKPHQGTNGGVKRQTEGMFTLKYSFSPIQGAPFINFYPSKQLSVLPISSCTYFPHAAIRNCNVARCELKLVLGSLRHSRKN